uniref:Uncharacterized protein n=1 Tax=candidate division WOR-3 bacterium TaxID=2052148 RepID=A0A7C6E9A4_UNCW3
MFDFLQSLDATAVLILFLFVIALIFLVILWFRANFLKQRLNQTEREKLELDMKLKTSHTEQLAQKLTESIKTIDAIAELLTQLPRGK